MGRTLIVQLAILSDIHYAGPRERLRVGYPLKDIHNPLQRAGIALYRRYFWQRDPFAHNHLLDQFISRASGSDFVIANGDYSCDSAAIGVADDAACESTGECLGKLRAAFPGRFEATIGDHELGKKPLGADKGGLRAASFFRAQSELQLQPFWQRTFGSFVLIGITSSLVALPIYAPEALHEELSKWSELRERHMQEIRAAFAGLRRDQRVILFCHDPTALPFLAQDGRIASKLNQMERTIIGHLHSRLILFKSRLLSGMPIIGFLGHTPKRLSAALRQARWWKPFKILLCPSLTGIELLKDGGFCTVGLDEGSNQALRFEFHRLHWSNRSIDRKGRSPQTGAPNANFRSSS